MTRLILGSSSIHRKQLLERLHLPFDTGIPNIDESPLAGEAPACTALRLAREKAQAIVQRHPGRLIIGSDQLAVLDGQPVGKPGNHENALKQLQAMRGRNILFHTALCLYDDRGDEPIVQLEDVQTRVHFRALSDAQLDTYLRIEQPYQVAGSAYFERLGIALIERIDTTDSTALIGLPLMALCTMLEKIGISPLSAGPR